MLVRKVSILQRVSWSSSMEALALSSGPDDVLSWGQNGSSLSAEYLHPGPEGGRPCEPLEHARAHESLKEAPRV
jgi:hypothetical protein